MREHLGVQPKVQPRTRPAASVTASETADADAPGDELKDRRESKARQLVGELLALAEEAFPGGMNTARGKPASLRDIQDALSVGQGKAQQVQVHFKTLQAATG